MTVREDAIQRPDGSTGTYGVVDKPDYALVIPLEAGKVMLVEQFRYPLGARRWEFPQGTAPDRAEADPATLAARELAEETGLRASALRELGMLDTAPGMAAQRGRVFLASGLARGEPAREHEEQDMRAAWFDRAHVEATISRGGIADAQSVAAYALLLLDEGR
jgi:8-oxo-dGTP pyrophosphatase MutT (NUDIX family)